MEEYFSIVCWRIRGVLLKLPARRVLIENPCTADEQFTFYVIIFYRKHRIIYNRSRSTTARLSSTWRRRGVCIRYITWVTSPVFRSATSTACKMKSICLVVVLVAVVQSVPAGPKYTTKYDNINIQEILNNDRLFNNYYKCLLDQGPCTPDAQELKASLKDALQTNCDKCSEKQKDGSREVFKFLIEKKPQQYAALEKKFDPKGIYKAKYQAEAAKVGIKL